MTKIKIALIIAVMSFILMVGCVPQQETTIDQEVTPDDQEDNLAQQETCRDSDGGNNILTKGTTSKGTKEMTDTCSDTSVVEYFCENNEISSTLSTCPADHECNQGECIIKVQEKRCSDSDGGNNILESGVTKVGEKREQDDCLGTKKVVEYYCQSGEIVSVVADCPSKHICSDAQCVSQEQEEEDGEGQEDSQTQITCVDSDGGKMHGQFGTVTKGTATHEDACSGDMLIEYYCENNEIKMETVSCGDKKECSSGVCMS